MADKSRSEVLKTYTEESKTLHPQLVQSFEMFTKHVSDGEMFECTSEVQQDDQNKVQNSQDQPYENPIQRKMRLRREARLSAAHKQQAAVVIQKLFRGYLARK